MLNNEIKYHGGKWYTELYGRFYVITKLFYNKDSKQNIDDANSYMESFGTDGVLKTLCGDKVIILANVQDKGVLEL